jgi:hypothetical protein
MGLERTGCQGMAYVSIQNFYKKFPIKVSFLWKEVRSQNKDPESSIMTWTK